MKKSSIKKNFAYQMMYEILVLILPFITSPYIARVIGAEGLGIYSFSYSVAYYFVLVSMLGIKNYGNRAVARVRDDPDQLSHTFSNILALHIIVSLICTLAYVGYIFTITEDRLYAVIQIFYVISGIFDISWFYFGTENFKLTVTRNTIIRIINVTMVFLFVRTRNDLWIYCLIMSIGFLVSQLTLWVPLHRYVKLVRPEWNKVFTHLKPMLILFIPAIAVSLYKYMDKIMIGTLSSKVQLGYYENAEKVINIPMTIIASFGTVMLPKMSNLAAGNNKNESRRYISVSMQFVMCMAFALSFGLSSMGMVFAPVFWGDAFEPSGVIIMGLSATIPFISFANVIRTQYLIPNERDKDYLISVISGAVVNLIINWLLIPVLGAYGAMIGTIVAEITVCLIQAFSVRKNLPLNEYIKSFVIFIGFGIIMFGAVYAAGYVCGRHVWTLVVQVAVGMLIYCTGAFVYFSKTKNPEFLRMYNNFKKKLKIKKSP